MAINDSESGVVFDPDDNRICLHGRYPLYHCPFCGGTFPDASQPLWVPIVPPEEFARLEKLVDHLHDPEAIIAQLGPPDSDALTHSYTENNGTLVRTNSPPVRNIEYYGYSEWLTIEFYISADKPATHRLVIKGLSAKHRKSAEDAPPDRGGD